MGYFTKGIVICSAIAVILLSGVQADAKGLLLKEGMQGEDVKQIQTSLKKLGYFDNDITGYYGSATKKAVEQFQLDREFVSDGIVGFATWSSLVGNIQPKSVKENEKTDKKTEAVVPEAELLKAALKKGMQDEQIKILQKRLKDLGFFNNDITGYYGEATEKAVEGFQKNNGISVDGVVGSGTWDKLFKVTGTERAERAAVSRKRDIRETSLREQIIEYAKDFLNIKYVWGGNTPSEGFDCSGYVKYVYNKFGIELQRVAADQAKGGKFVSKENLKPCDLVFFDTDGGHNYINHVGMYIGDGMFIHASSGSGKVVINNMTEGFYKTSYMTARRYLE